MRRLAGPVLLAALAGGILLPNANGATADPHSTGTPSTGAPSTGSTGASAGLATLILARQSPAGRTVANHPAAVLARPASPAHVSRRGMVWPGCDTPLV